MNKIHKSGIHSYSSLFLTVLFFITPAAGISAMDITEKSTMPLITDNSEISIYIHAGRMTGKGNEYVMDGNRELSKLIWKIDSLYLAGGGMEWNISPGMLIKTDLWLKTKDGDSVMDDYDWLIDGMDWTHWSHHDDTTVTKAVIFDIELEFDLEKLRDSPFRIKPLVGYRLTDFEWEARGGSFIYTSNYTNPSTFRDTEGLFPNGQLGITYEQIFHTPYIGVEFEIPAGVFFLTSKFTGSFAVFGRAIDHHHLRDLVTTAYFLCGNMVSANISAGVNLPVNIKLSGSYTYMKYGNLRGDSKYEQNGTVTVYDNIEKADFEANMFSISVSYSF